jgi:hypothetical protein
MWFVEGANSSLPGNIPQRVQTLCYFSLGACGLGAVLGATATKSGVFPEPDACSVHIIRPSSGQFGGSVLRVAIVDRRAP